MVRLLQYWASVFYRKQRQFWNPVTLQVKFKLWSQNLGLDFSDPSHKSDFKTVFPWPPGTPMTSHKLRNAFCKTCLPYLARDKWLDHHFKNCSEIRPVTSIRKMWDQSQTLPQWLEIRPKLALLFGKMFAQFRKRRIIQSWFQNVFWNQCCDVVHNLPWHFAFSNLYVFHSILLVRSSQIGFKMYTFEVFM